MAWRYVTLTTDDKLQKAPSRGERAGPQKNLAAVDPLWRMCVCVSVQSVPSISQLLGTEWKWQPEIKAGVSL